MTVERRIGRRFSGRRRRRFFFWQTTQTAFWQTTPPRGWARPSQVLFDISARTRLPPQPIVGVTQVFERIELFHLPPPLTWQRSPSGYLLRGLVEFYKPHRAVVSLKRSFGICTRQLSISLVPIEFLSVLSYAAVPIEDYTLTNRRQTAVIPNSGDKNENPNRSVYGSPYQPSRCFFLFCTR